MATLPTSGLSRQPAGFSVVELLVAVLLLAVGAIAASTVQRAAARSGQVVSLRQPAAELARQLLEIARVTPYNNPTLAPGTGTPPPYVQPPAAVSAANPLDAAGQNPGNGFRPFARTWQILNDFPVANVKKISVRVTWSQYGQNHELQMSTLKVK